MERLSRLGRYARGRFLMSGLTLFELIFTLSIASLLFFVAVPSVGNFLQSSQLRSDQDKLQSILSAARMSAVTTGQHTVVCRWNGLDNCTGSSLSGSLLWDKGALAFVDHNQNRIYEPASENIVRIISFSNITEITWNRGEALVYEADGTLRGGSNGTFRLVNGDDTYRLVLSITGRVRRTLE